MKHALKLALLLAVDLGAQEVHALEITFNPGLASSYTYEHARDGDLGGPRVEHYLALPDSGTSPGSADGDSFAQISYWASDAGIGAAFTNRISATEHSVSNTWISINFSVDHEIDYSITGAYSALDSEGRRIGIEARLIDIAANNSILLQTYQVSENTANESFSLGLQEGDLANLLTGSLAGTLLPAREYLFLAQAYFEGETSSWPNPGWTTAASGYGSIALVFVPEPSSGVLMGIGLVLLGIRNRAS